MGKVHKSNKVGTYSRVAQVAQFNKDKEDSLRKVAEKVNEKYPQFDYCVEVYHNNSLSKMPNIVGLSIFYPSSDETTHQLCKEYPGGITDAQVHQFFTGMCEELITKIPKE